jgi:siroheme synthase (precorrin-2 oxidase/ferrochelatase)
VAAVNLFPAFLRLDGRDVLLVGGGSVAAAFSPVSGTGKTT